MIRVLLGILVTLLRAAPSIPDESPIREEDPHG
jgi:hypothetical protein